jgi:hypothetical protein
MKFTQETVTVYIADDGTRFGELHAAENYCRERNLVEKLRADTAMTWVEAAALAGWMRKNCALVLNYLELLEEKPEVWTRRAVFGNTEDGK